MLRLSRGNQGGCRKYARKRTHRAGMNEQPQKGKTTAKGETTNDFTTLLSSNAERDIHHAKHLARFSDGGAGPQMDLPVIFYHPCADMSTPDPKKPQNCSRGVRPPKIVRSLETWHENQDSQTGNNNRDGWSGPCDPGIGGGEAYDSAAAVTCSRQGLLMAETETLRASIVFRSLRIHNRTKARNR